MFSISKFLFDQDLLKEGGNTRALLRDPVTGKVASPEQVKKFRGREGYAQKIDLKSSRIKRREFTRDVIEMLNVLDAEYKADRGNNIWDPSTRDSVLNSGEAFNGSSAHLFAPPETMPDEKFVEYKPTVGDIDLTIPAETMSGLYSTLNRLEDRQLTPKIAYIGHNKKSDKEDQINALFAYTWDQTLPEGEGDTFFQIDFEASEYTAGRPTDWARFSHSSSWEDISRGVKGLAHKFLLMTLVSVSSPAPINSKLAVPSATAENPKLSMTVDSNFVPPSDEEIRDMIEKRSQEILRAMKKPNPEKARAEAEKAVKSEIKLKSMRPKYPGSLKSFNVGTGISTRYKKQDWNVGDSNVYKYLQSSEREPPVKEIMGMFVEIFGENPPPTEEDLKKFWSYVGLLSLVSERLSPQESVKVYERFVNRLYGEGAQGISATDPKEDESVKDAIIRVFQEDAPDVRASTLDLAAMKEKYYASYKVRGQEGFKEDESPASDVSESRRILRRLLRKNNG